MVKAIYVLNGSEVSEIEFDTIHAAREFCDEANAKMTFWFAGDGQPYPRGQWVVAE